MKFLDIFKKKKILPSVKFHKNPSTEDRVVGYGQTEVQADMTELKVVFLNFANALNA